MLLRLLATFKAMILKNSSSTFKNRATVTRDDYERRKKPWRIVR